MIPPEVYAEIRRRAKDHAATAPPLSARQRALVAAMFKRPVSPAHRGPTTSRPRRS